MVNPHIVITTIFHPSRAVKRYSQIEDTQLIVVGDRKTPAGWACDRTLFLSIDEQKKNGHALAKILPENHYSRKMLGYIQAVNNGAEVIIDTDDDNIPKENWQFPNFQGKFQVTGQDLDFINIYRYYSDKKIWPRGLPLDCIDREPTDAENGEDFDRQEVKVGVWQGLADGDPDVDAIYRLVINEACYFAEREPLVLGRGTLTPFNSQNTAFRKEVFPLLYLPAFVNFRFTDILRGLVAQPILWLYDYHLGFTNAIVFQDRNEHDYLKDFESEIPCFLHGHQIIETVEANLRTGYSIGDNLYEAYQALCRTGIVKNKEMKVLSAWLKALQPPD